MLTLNTEAPQGCVPIPPLYSLFTHDCVAVHTSNTIIKFAGDTTVVVDLITNDDETGYREEVRYLAVWCRDNNLSLNVGKTNELIVDYRKRMHTHGTLPTNTYTPNHTHTVTHTTRIHRHTLPYITYAAASVYYLSCLSSIVPLRIGSYIATLLYHCSLCIYLVLVLFFYCNLLVYTCCLLSMLQ
jgi:hypothetical protein